MRTFKLLVSYDGTNYFGWQAQSGQRSVQETIEAAIARVTGQSVRILASGRTDAGVHALGQVVSFRLRNPVNARGFMPGAKRRPARRHRGARSLRDARWFSPHASGPAQTLPLSDPRRAGSGRISPPVLLAFQPRPAGCRGHAPLRRCRLSASTISAVLKPPAPGRKDSVRTIFDLSIQRGRGDEQDWITIEVEADGFLYNMVRAIVGTLVEVGRGVKPETWPAEVLLAADRRLAGPTAPPQGLFLVKVDY